MTFHELIISKLHPLRQFIFVAFAVICCPAIAYEYGELALTQDKVIGADIGKLTFELIILDGHSKPIYGEIHVKTSERNKIQTIPVESWLPQLSFDFIDLNDDGYLDLLFYNAQAGYAAGPSTGADVFLYIPKLKKFTKSKTLSGAGNITKAESKGCVVVNYKSSMAGYTDEEWCFNQKVGSWGMVKSITNEPSAE
jgi:hypothetical protein